MRPIRGHDGGMDIEQRDGVIHERDHSDRLNDRFQLIFLVQNPIWDKIDIF